jgi:RNA polymerase sigma-70 factor (ECF subfamily)
MAVPSPGCGTQVGKSFKFPVNSTTHRNFLAGGRFRKYGLLPLFFNISPLGDMEEETMEITADMTNPLALPAVTQSFDRSLVERAQCGCGNSFRQLVEPHLEMLHRIAYRACGQNELAEDAVQETLTLAYERLGQYRPEAPFKSFLAAVAVRRAKTLLRSESRRRVREGKSRPAWNLFGPEESLVGAQTATIVRHALLKMPAKRREVVLLRLDAGLSYREIADAQGISEGSARVLVHMGLKQIKELMKKEVTMV